MSTFIFSCRRGVQQKDVRLAGTNAPGRGGSELRTGLNFKEIMSELGCQWFLSPQLWSRNRAQVPPTFRFKFPHFWTQAPLRLGFLLKV